MPPPPLSEDLCLSSLSKDWREFFTCASPWPRSTSEIDSISMFQTHAKGRTLAWQPLLLFVCVRPRDTKRIAEAPSWRVCPWSSQRLGNIVTDNKTEIMCDIWSTLCFSFLLTACHMQLPVQRVTGTITSRSWTGGTVFISCPSGNGRTIHFKPFFKNNIQFSVLFAKCYPGGRIKKNGIDGSPTGKRKGACKILVGKS
jgi:hypothetical protein